MLPAATADAPPSVTAATKCSSLPAPPHTITGIDTAPATLRRRTRYKVMNKTSASVTALQKVGTEVGSISDSGLRTRNEEIGRDAARLTQDATGFVEIIDQSKAPTH